MLELCNIIFFSCAKIDQCCTRLFLWTHRKLLWHYRRNTLQCRRSPADGRQQRSMWIILDISGASSSADALTFYWCMRACRCCCVSKPRGRAEERSGNTNDMFCSWLRSMFGVARLECESLFARCCSRKSPVCRGRADDFTKTSNSSTAMIINFCFYCCSDFSLPRSSQFVWTQTAKKAMLSLHFIRLRRRSSVLQSSIR